MTKPLRSRSCYGGCKGTHPTICEQEGCAIVVGAHLKAKGERLRPCPFCGGAGQQHEVGTEDEKNAGALYVSCGSCNASTAIMFPCGEDASQKILDLWNKRTK